VTTVTDVHVLPYIPAHFFTDINITNATDVRSRYYAYKREVTSNPVATRGRFRTLASRMLLGK